MKVTEIIEKSRAKGDTIFSIEILPPLKGQRIEDIFETIDSLRPFDIKFINVTYHRHEIISYTNSAGEVVQVPYKKRPGTIAICAAIQNRYKIETIPHIICSGFTREETEDALIDMKFLGIENVLALRGDALKTEPVFTPTVGGHQYASELMEQIKETGKGNYLHHSEKSEDDFIFCMGVAVYPEKHAEAKTAEEDFDIFKLKVHKGADFAVTQMFFDNQKLYKFVDKCESENIHIPIIPGLKPITTLKQIDIIPKLFHCELPEPFLKELKKAKTNQEVREIGIEWCIYQCKDMLKNGFDILHFYTMGKKKVVQRIAEAVL